MVINIIYSLMSKLSEDFLEAVLKDIKEFDSSSIPITVEFAVHKDNLEDFKKFVRGLSTKGIWNYFICNTCIKYHGAGYIHCELLDK